MRKIYGVKAAQPSAELDLLAFLGKDEASEVKLSKIPRIILVAQGFSTEITTTALWLMEHMKIEIACYTVALYPYGEDFVLHFDLLLPLPQQADYFVKVRDKNNEEAEQAAVVQRRQRACQLLEACGLLKPGDSLELVKLPRAQMNVADVTQKKAIYLGGGRARWNFDQKEYALSTLTVALCAINDMPLSNLQGPAYWGKAGTGVSLADEARASDLEKSVALKANSGLLTGDHG